MIPNKVEDTFKDANWTEAMNVEIEAQSGALEMVSLPKGKKACWVYMCIHSQA